MIERLVLAEEERILAAIEPDSPPWRAYFDDKPSRRNDADHGREHGVSITST